MIPLTRLVARSLGAASRFLGTRLPGHLQTARWGEMEAYFYLRSLGYCIVAKNFRTSHNRGEIDIVGWDDGVLCFVEVKTHSQHGLVPPEIAVDTAKRAHIRSVARRYVRQLHMDKPPKCRFDVVSVVLADDGRDPSIRLHKGAFAWNSFRGSRRDFAWRPDRLH